MSESLMYFQRETSREFGRISGQINQRYGGRNHKCLIESDHYFANVYKYVYRNPVRAKITRECADYPYSTLAGLYGYKPLRIPVTLDPFLFDPNFNQKTHEWLNHGGNPEHEAELKRALKRTVFRLAPQQNRRRPSMLESLRY